MKNNLIKPITLDEVGLSTSYIPDKVIEIVNNHISRKYSHGSACILQQDIVKDICETMQVTETEIYRNQWLDFENIFRKAGWDVDYDKPGYCESYSASFTFTPKKS